MNKSVEFIEKEINHLKIVLSCMIGKEAKENIANKLNQFQQIKTELEAWEEIKKYIVLMEEQYPLYDTTYEYIELENGCIDESNTDEEGKSIMIIKRALEINYESEE